MRITNEEQLLDPVIRKVIIDEIESSENKKRKDEHYKRYQCYKDSTNIHVLKQLLNQFDQDTVREMGYAISNIAFVRKVIDKLARVYKYGIQRVTKNEKTNEAIETIQKSTDLNAQMKKTNRFFKLHKNVAVYVCPKKTELSVDSKKTIKVIPLAPYLYDAIEQADDREKPACYILSDYEVESTQDSYSTSANAAQRAQKSLVTIRQGNNKDEMIADTPQDQQQYGNKDNKQYVWWSKNYHFTTNKNGDIISEDFVNPIGQMPFVNFAEDQDGTFWAQGGQDLTDGAILVNSMISNINHIAITQGYGQLVMTGKNLPRNQKVGPNKAVLLEYDKGAGEEAPTFEFKTANPPLDQLRSLVEMYVALLLTTNNLSTSGVSSKLDGALQFPSGIAMMLDKAESMEDIEDQRQIFIDNEPVIWQLIAKWHATLKNSGELDDALVPLTIDETEEIQLKFEKPVVIQSEKEKLEVLKLKDEMGLVSKLDILRQEYPDYDDEQLKAKLEEILTEAKERMEAFANESQTGDGNEDGNIEYAGPSDSDEPTKERTEPDQE